MKLDDLLYCPIYSITHNFKTIQGADALLFELIEKNGKPFLRYRIGEEELGDSYDLTFRKFRFTCIGLSVATLGHFWVGDELIDDELNSVWANDRGIQLVADKEILPTGKTTVTAKDIIIGEDLTCWIASSYPRVFTYYTTALFLLRASIPSEYLYADVLLNFYKIVELITYKRTSKNPELKVIRDDSKTLGISCVDKSDMKRFSIVRNRDAAHDYDKAQEITRQQAVECKLWADELIVRDLMNRAEKPSLVAMVRESVSGASIAPKRNE